MKRLLMVTIAGVFLIMTFSLAGAAQVIVDAPSTITVDGVPYTLVSPAPDYSGLMWEEIPVGKACLCKMSAFRALQALGTFLSLSEFSSAQLSIVTGWNTHGPEELFVDSLTWVKGTNFAYADPITSGSLLTLADAWYEFTYSGVIYRVAHDSFNYRFAHVETHAGYHPDWDFFDYRLFIQTTGGSTPEKDYFSSVIRPQIVANFRGETWFEVNAVPIPGAVWLLGTGIMGLAARRWRMARRDQNGSST